MIKKNVIFSVCVYCWGWKATKFSASTLHLIFVAESVRSVSGLTNATWCGFLCAAARAHCPTGRAVCVMQSAAGLICILSCVGVTCNQLWLHYTFKCLGEKPPSWNVVNWWCHFCAVTGITGVLLIGSLWWDCSQWRASSVNRLVAGRCFSSWGAWKDSVYGLHLAIVLVTNTWWVHDES